MCTVLLPPGDNPIAVNKYIIWTKCATTRTVPAQIYLSIKLLITVCGLPNESNSKFLTFNDVSRAQAWQAARYTLLQLEVTTDRLHSLWARSYLWTANSLGERLWSWRGPPNRKFHSTAPPLTTLPVLLQINSTNTFTMAFLPDSPQLQRFNNSFF